MFDAGRKKFNKFHFDGQKQGEQILLVLHRHWFDILSQFFLLVLMLFLLIGSFAYLPLIFPTLSEGQNRNLFLFLENFFLLLLWIMSFLVWIDYYFDVWIVTDQRIVNIEQKGLFSRIVSELELEKIQDITSDVKGVIATFLNFGDLQVQTAAEQERFLFHNIPDPYTVKNMIMNLRKLSEDKEEEQFGEMLREKIHKDDIA
jgi:hypothetical protein